MKDFNKMGLSIVIPSVSYRSYLDEAIESCLSVSEHDVEIVVCVNNIGYNGFSKSNYFDSPLIKWHCLGQPVQPMWKSLNKAIERSSGRWIFLLSDDDVIRPNFLRSQALNEKDDFFLYATRVDIIDEKGRFVRRSGSPTPSEIHEFDPIELFFKRKFHNHLSLFVFSRVMYDKVGGFRDTGYPNGYFVDTVFHGQVLANCSAVYAEQSSVFLRRESLGQGSAKFYLGSVVNKYMSEVVTAFWDDATFADQCALRYRTKDGYFQELLYQRFFTEWSKLGKSVYGQRKVMRFYLLFSYLVLWAAGPRNKVRVVQWLMVLPVSFVKRRLCGLIK
ncbi:glycosyltransferase family 2 protein [Spiribacter sp. 1M153]|uniref:glycosyltransferase family 2 protein n=1 Tax=Spiribacter roseus TaxID=1855875 RepID=UPI00349F109A